jgi:hypothetical protein
MAEAISTDLWSQHFLEPLVLLAKDKVPNIRIATARSIASIVKLGAPIS